MMKCVTSQSKIMDTSRNMLLAEGTSEGSNDDYSNFRRLYDKILEYFLKSYEISDFQMNTAISCIIDSVNWEKKELQFSDLNFGDPEFICGYIFRYGPHGAGLTRCRTLEALRNCVELRAILEKPDLNVISLGGGPGNDAIGFCSALSNSQFTGKMDIRIVDAAMKWEEVVILAAEFLRGGDFGDASKLFEQGKVEISFHPFKLPEDLNHLRLENVDIVLLCRLISIMNSEDKEALIEGLHSKMKDSAFILLIDSPSLGESGWNDFLGEKEWKRFECLYWSRMSQVYVSGPPVQRFGHNDGVSSRARIAVLKKKNSSAPDYLLKKSA